EDRADPRRGAAAEPPRQAPPRREPAGPPLFAITREPVTRTTFTEAAATSCRLARTPKLRESHDPFGEHGAAVGRDVARHPGIAASPTFEPFRAAQHAPPCHGAE